MDVKLGAILIDIYREKLTVLYPRFLRSMVENSFELMPLVGPIDNYYFLKLSNCRRETQTRNYKQEKQYGMRNFKIAEVKWLTYIKGRVKRHIINVLVFILFQTKRHGGRPPPHWKGQ